LIHYVGDYHQPLHCLNRVDPSFPKGDAGGNDFPLPDHYDVDELHALWDSVIYTLHASVTLPFTADTWTSFGTASEAIASNVTVTSSEEKDITFKDWND